MARGTSGNRTAGTPQGSTRTWRRTWGVLACSVVGVEAVLANHVVVVALVVTAVTTGVLAFGLALSTPHGDPDWGRAVPLGWYAGIGVVAFGVVARFDVGLAFLLLVGCAVTSPWVLHRRRHQEVAAAPPVEDLRLPDLCRAWTDSFARLERAGTAQEHADVVDRRQSYLDELARRDPDSFAMWLKSGAAAAGDPSPYFSVARYDEGHDEAA